MSVRTSLAVGGQAVGPIFAVPGAAARLGEFPPGKAVSCSDAGGIDESGQLEPFGRTVSPRAWTCVPGSTRGTDACDDAAKPTSMKRLVTITINALRPIVVTDRKGDKGPDSVRPLVHDRRRLQNI